MAEAFGAAGRGDAAGTGRPGPDRLGRRHLLRRAEPMPPARRPAADARVDAVDGAWCADFAASDNYGGVCDVHRLQLLVATDDYRRLEARLVAASQALEDVNSWAAGEGYYQLGEVLRLRVTPTARSQPSRGPAPSASIRSPARRCCAAGWATARPRGRDLRVALAGEDRLGRMRLLRGAVEVALARDSPRRGRTAIAANWKTVQRLSARRAFGPGRRMRAVRSWCSAGSTADALEALQSALREYRIQKSRYETAQIYEWMALAHRGLGDDERRRRRRRHRARASTTNSASNRRGICGSTVARRADQTRARDPDRDRPRRHQPASGPADLHQSRRRSARHLANIYAKLGVSSRTAAVDWAHQHNLLK